MADDALWRELHSLQTAMCFPLELPIYYASPSWLRARSVLDVGAGHGDYLRGLVRRFPEKSYLGIDIEPSYIEAAAATVESRAIAFAVGDVMTFEGSYEFVIARLLLQHLEDPGRAVSRLGQLTAPGGSALIIDALDCYRAFYPPLLAYAEFFEAYRELERAAGRDRDIMQRVPDLARATGIFEVREWDVLIPSTFPGHLDIFRAVYSRVINLLTPALREQCDTAEARREFDRWCADDLAYAQVGLRIARLDRM